jgi:Helix-turn-helix of DDE superfamily endonuclease
MDYQELRNKNMFWEKIKKHKEGDFKRLTGVELKTFKMMVKEVERSDAEKNKKKGNNRSRPYLLSIENQILMMLMYYREYRTQFHIGETYGLHESNVSKNIRRIENILKKCKKFSLPGKEKLSGTNHQFEVILVDATESPIERPKKNSIYITPGKRKSIR